MMAASITVHKNGPPRVVHSSDSIWIEFPLAPDGADLTIFISPADAESLAGELVSAATVVRPIIDALNAARQSER